MRWTEVQFARTNNKQLPLLVPRNRGADRTLACTGSALAAERALQRVVELTSAVSIEFGNHVSINVVAHHLEQTLPGLV